MAKQHHPDKNTHSNKTDSEEKVRSDYILYNMIGEFLVQLLPFQFKEISFAHEVLTDPNKRAAYDRGGLEALKEGGAPGKNEFVGGV